MSILSVSQLNMYIHSIIEGDSKLKTLFVSGEISNIKIHTSGHIYFSLKDENSVIRAVMFKGNTQRLKFLPYDGLKVICNGSVSVYEKDGIYQFYVTDMQPDGMGSAALALSQLKERLEKEGLFLEEHKRTLPVFPKKIAVITSSSGAAVQDVINVISRRYPLCELCICSANVQGEFAEQTILESFNTVNKTDCDVLIVTRGGGSKEDLSVFNSEKIARAAYNSKIPVVSAVGHQTDYTILDYVADLRAPTPSAAAEMVTPDITEMKNTVTAYFNTLIGVAENFLDNRKLKLDSLKRRLEYSDIDKKTQGCLEKVEILNRQLYASYDNLLKQKINGIENKISKLAALNPLSVLKRGYTVVYSDKNVINSVKKIEKNQNIEVVFEDGTAECNVLSVNHKKIGGAENE